MTRAALLASLVLFVAGCPGNDLRGRTHGIRDIIRQARDNGAYKCAPRELAMAESHLEFATAELDAGKYFPAKREVGVSEDNARKALELSPRDRCNPPPVPKVIDTDGDGIPDKVDKCPTEPEDKDGFQDADGCPDPDNDNDGILDKDDKCPNEPEDKDGFEDEDGCPDPDNDKDGILDVNDKCPNEPETYNGYQDEDGCPDKGNVIIEGDKLVILKKIKFKVNSAEILPESNEILDAVATTVTHHPEFTLIEVAGHADERADDNYNLKLTQDRVNSVMAALIARKVDRTRLRAKGYGEYCPEDPGHNEEAWEKNRRVEFKIVKTKDGPTGVELGCDTASRKGVKPDPVP